MKIQPKVVKNSLKINNNLFFKKILKFSFRGLGQLNSLN